MKSGYYRDNPNPQVTAIVNAQTDIKSVIKKGVLSGTPFYVIKKSISRIVEKLGKGISSQSLRNEVTASLLKFADTTYKQFVSDLKIHKINVLSAVLLIGKALGKSNSEGEYFEPNTSAEKKAVETLRRSSDITFSTTAKGLPLNQFHKLYFDKVKTALNNLASSQAIAPDDVERRMSLRAYAEMQVRYENHLQQIEDFKNNGVKLVVCSVHADCSDRCRNWQGKVYSLDGTYGVTEDGKRYQPLENATDIFYTTKAGKVYKNGLLGFNCRHVLYPYKPGMVIPTVSREQQQKEYEITKNQRSLERKVINARERALANKGTIPKEYKRWKEKATKYFNDYVAYSQQNKRAYYPDRIKIL